MLTTIQLGNIKDFSVTVNAPQISSPNWPVQTFLKLEEVIF